MKYRALCTNCVDSLRRWYPEISVINDATGESWAECDTEYAAEAIEKLNKLAGNKKVKKLIGNLFKKLYENN